MGLLGAPRRLAIALLAAVLGCAPAAKLSPPPPIAPPKSSEGGMRVEKVREELQLAPWDLAFSAIRGTGVATETVTARNLTDEPVTVRALPVLGDGAPPFELRNPPKLPAIVPPKGQLSVEVTFAPPASAPLGVHRALLRFQTGPTPEDGPGTDLSALATVGRAGDHEPTLAEVVEALGYAVDVRSARAAGPAPATADHPDGDEVPVQLFTRASPSVVALNPVARFSADGPRPFGPYMVKAGGMTPQMLATLADGQHQTLNPDLESGGNASFDPGDAVFGLWVRAGKRTVYTEDHRNSGNDKHAARVFPLHARGGAPIPNAYLVAFRDGADDAFQDYVFVLWNAKPAGATTSTPPAATAPAPRSP